MRIYFRFSSLIVFSGFLFALAGCARSPRVAFYTLSPMEQTGGVSAPLNISVAVAPVTLPEFVDRPQLVLNADGSRVHVLETHRWAEPLKNSIPRILAENLSRLLGTDRVSFYPQSASSEAGYRISVDFQQFESAGDTVRIDALWAIRTPAAGPGTVHRSKISEPAAGDENGARVAAYSRGLAALSRDIAASLRQDAALPR